MLGRPLIQSGWRNSQQTALPTPFFFHLFLTEPGNKDSNKKRPYSGRTYNLRARKPLNTTMATTGELWKCVREFFLCAYFLDCGYVVTILVICDRGLNDNVNVVFCPIFYQFSFSTSSSYGMQLRFVSGSTNCDVIMLGSKFWYNYDDLIIRSFLC